jgi:hypothetical protein
MLWFDDNGQVYKGGLSIVSCLLKLLNTQTQGILEHTKY